MNRYAAYIDRIATFAVNFSVLIALARILTPEDFGVAAVSIFLVTILLIVRDFGFGSALISQGVTAHSGQATSYFWVNLLISCAAAAVLFALSGPLSAVLRDGRVQPVLALNSLAILFYNGAAIHLALLRAKFDNTGIMIANVTGALAGGMASIGLAIVTRRPEALVVGQVVQSAIAAAIYTFRLRWIPTPFSWNALRSTYGQLASGASISGFSVLTYLTNNVAVPVLLFLHGSAASGFFARAQALYTLPLSFFVQPYLTVQYARMCAVPRGSPELRHIYAASLTVTSCFLMAAGLALPFVADGLVRLLLGARFTDTATVLAWFGPALFVMGLNAPVGQLLASQGKTRFLVIWSGVDLVIRGGCTAIGCLYGPSAASAAFSSASVLFVAPVLSIAVNRYGVLTYKEQVMAIAPGAMLALLAVGSLVLTKLFLGRFGDDISFLGSVVAGALAWLLGGLIWRRTLPRGHT